VVTPSVLQYTFLTLFCHYELYLSIYVNIRAYIYNLWFEKFKVKDGRIICILLVTLQPVNLESSHVF